jgi:hypothetical protein
MDAGRFDTLVQTLAASPRSRRRFVAALIAAGLTSFSRRAHAQPQWRHLLPLCVLTGCPPGEECFRNGCCSPRQSCVEVCCPPETVGCERILGPAGVSYTCLCPNGFEFREDLNQCVPCGIPGAPCAADAACCAGSCCNGTCCNGNCVGGMCCAATPAVISAATRACSAVAEPRAAPCAIVAVESAVRQEPPAGAANVPAVARCWVPRARTASHAVTAPVARETRSAATGSDGVVASCRRPVMSSVPAHRRYPSAGRGPAAPQAVSPSVKSGKV